jgi:serine protease SohB
VFWNLAKRRSLISVTNLNDLYADTINDVRLALGSNVKNFYRNRSKKRIFVIDFNGDTMASQSRALSFEVTSVICNAKPGDEVLVRVNSPGGAAHMYGYAASQLSRLKVADIPLTVSVDKIAASGGYMMACIGDKIISAPWAIIGSIGVVTEFPNFYNFLQNLGIDYKQYTAGEFKRTVTPMGPITAEGEAKFKSDLLDVYELFRNHVSSNRPSLLETIDQVATGEHWQGTKALELNLVDEIKTSEEYILENIKTAEMVQIRYVGDRKTLLEKLGSNLSYSFANGFVKSIFNNFMNFSVNYRYMR